MQRRRELSYENASGREAQGCCGGAGFVRRPEHDSTMTEAKGRIAAVELLAWCCAHATQSSPRPTTLSTAVGVIQKKITAHENPMTISEMDNQINEYLSTIDTASTYVELAFYGGSFTGIPESLQELYLSNAYTYLKENRIHGIRLSTRPDYISDEVIKRLLHYEVALVELGVQSLDDDVLIASKRGYKSEIVYKSVEKLKRANIGVGIQLMIGLPEDSLEKVLKTTKQVIEFKPITIRIYPTLVIQDTLLSELFSKGIYKPLDLDTAVKWTAEMVKLFRKQNINIIRIGLQPTDLITQGKAVITGAFHPAFRQLVESYLLKEKMIKTLEAENKKNKNWIVISNLKTQSLWIGQHRSNIVCFEKQGYKIFSQINNELKDGEIIFKTI